MDKPLESSQAQWDKECCRGGDCPICNCNKEEEETVEQEKITRENYPEFKRLYENAVKTNSETFLFGKQLVLTAYAKYVVEYVETTG